MGTGRLPVRLFGPSSAQHAIRRGACAWTTEHLPLSQTIAILSRGDAAARRDATPQNSRFVRVFEALSAVGIDARPVVYDEAFADAVREQLWTVDGVLVWVDPIHQGKTRAALDQLLREVAAQGPWVSAHPDIILKMGVKEVLYRTRHLGWGADTHRYDRADAFRGRIPFAAAGERAACAETKPRQRRPGRMEGGGLAGLGRDGPGTSCAARKPAGGHATRNFHRTLRTLFRMGRLHHRSGIPAAPVRGDDPLLHERLQGRRFRSATDQGVDPAAAGRSGLPEAQPGPRIMHGPDAAPFQALRRSMEDEWTPQMMQNAGHR